MVIRYVVGVFPLIFLAGCAPELDDRISRITSPRVIALAAFPAEAPPTASVTLRGLYVDSQGELSMQASSWAFCVERKPLTELGPVAPSCLFAAGEGILPLGEGSTAIGSIPADACRLFGPDRPEPKAGEPAGRPVDPDSTGGYYQPFRIDVGNAFVSGAVRVTCGLGGATPAQAATFRDQYIPNEAPVPNALGVRRGANMLESLADDPNASVIVGRGERVSLEISWPHCDTDASCSGAESYLWFDPEKRMIKTRRESIRISWFVTAGEFEFDRTGRSESESEENTSQNGFTAPNEPGDVSVWVVARDDRGGVGWRAGKLRVE